MDDLKVPDHGEWREDEAADDGGQWIDGDQEHQAPVEGSGNLFSNLKIVYMNAVFAYIHLCFFLVYNIKWKMWPKSWTLYCTSV